ncbi:MAG: hypothetical protein AAF696_34925 [Bacteroidota bacterium]
MLVLLIFLGTFQFEGVLAETAISQIEVAYVELVAQESNLERFQTLGEVSEQLLPRTTSPFSIYLKSEEVLAELLSRKALSLYKQQDILLKASPPQAFYFQDIRTYPPSHPLDSV